MVIRVKANADELEVKLVHGDKGGTGTGEGIENGVVRLRECCCESLHACQTARGFGKKTVAFEGARYNAGNRTSGR